MSKKKDKKYVKGIIEDIRVLTTATIPAEANQGKYSDVNAYISGPRAALNVLLIEAMLGCEMKSDKAKFNHKLPSKEEIAEVCSLLSAFIDGVENPILNAIAKSTETPATEGQQVSTDMSIPKMEIAIGGQVQRVSMIDKVDNKKLKKELFDHDMVRRIMLNPTDCLMLAAMGEKARKKDTRNKMLIIGGVALLLTGAAVAGVMIYNHNKHDDEELKVGDEIVGGDVPDIDDGDIPGIEDNPQVEIE